MAQFPFTQEEYERLFDALFGAYSEAQSNAVLFTQQGFHGLAERSYKLSEEYSALADLVYLKMDAERAAGTCPYRTAEEWYEVFKEYYDERHNVQQEAV